MSFSDVSNVVAFPRLRAQVGQSASSSPNEQPLPIPETPRISAWPIILVYRPGEPVLFVRAAEPCAPGQTRAIVLVLFGRRTRHRRRARRVVCTCPFFDAEGTCIHVWEASIQLASATRAVAR